VKRSLIFAGLTALFLVFNALNAHARPTVKQRTLAYKYTTYKLLNNELVNMSPSQLAIANGLWTPLAPTALYNRCLKTIVEVINRRGQDDYIQGTGFFINKDTIITNYHVVRGHLTLSIRTSDNRILLRWADYGQQPSARLSAGQIFHGREQEMDFICH
jgi:S1-C subfamily serine protease